MEETESKIEPKTEPKTESKIEPKIELTAYQKHKASIIKWRQKNRIVYNKYMQNYQTKKRAEKDLLLEQEKLNN